MKLCIQVDHPRWAQALHGYGLQRFAPSGMDVSVQLLSDAIPRGTECLYTINVASCRRQPGLRVATCAASHAWLYSANDPADWRTRGVNPNRNSKCFSAILNANAVVCRNKALTNAALAIHSNACCLPAGVDPTIWHPAGRTRRNSKLRVGWSGQVNPEMSGRFKGFDEVWLPLKSKLGARYEFVENARTAANALSWDEMRQWYCSLDVFLTTASAEGTPNAPFIAAACGAVVISTDVGQVSDWSTLRNAGLIVPSFGNATEAADVISLISLILSRLENDSVRLAKQEILMASIEHSYSYRVVAPKTLAFVCGVNP